MTTLTDVVRRTRREIAAAETPVRRELLTLWRDAYRRVEVHLLALTRQIEVAKLAGETVDPDWLRRQGRYRTLLASIDEETRRLAAWGLVLLLLAVFPANINMASNDIPLDGRDLPTWALWGRLPIQALLVAWAWWYTRPDRD